MCIETVNSTRNTKRLVIACNHKYVTCMGLHKVFARTSAYTSVIDSALVELQLPSYMTNLLHCPGRVPQRCVCRCSGLGSAVHYTNFHVPSAGIHGDVPQVICLHVASLPPCLRTQACTYNHRIAVLKSLCGCLCSHILSNASQQLNPQIRRKHICVAKQPV